MALSEQEQRLLEQMEAALEAEDPRFANVLRGPQHQLHRPRLILAVVVFAAGMTALVVGMDVHPVVSVLGFVGMLVGAVVAVSSVNRAESGPAAAGGHPGQAERDRLGRIDDRRRGEDDTR